VIVAAALVLSTFCAAQDTPKIEIKGCMKVEGISFKQGEATKYTGDTYLLKLLFTNDKGDVYQPTPTLNFVVYNGQTPYKKVQRILTKEQWKADAAGSTRTPSRTIRSPATRRPGRSGLPSSAPTRTSTSGST